MTSIPKNITVIGFGSQAHAWSHCLRLSGWNVTVLMHRKSASFEHAVKDQFQVQLLEDWFKEKKKQISETTPTVIAFLCPDDQIKNIYEAYFGELSHERFLFIVAHGFCVYSKDIQLNENFSTLENQQHSWALFAPKAIGPKILENYKKGTHGLVAAVSAAESDFESIKSLAHAMRFSLENLVWTDFEKETIGDLISEQLLLCGGVFSLLALAYEEMQKAGIPPRLIREECLSELSLIADLLAKNGALQTSNKISKAAQCGAALVYNDFLKSDFIQLLKKRVERIHSKEFVSDFQEKEIWGGFKKKWQEKVKEYAKEYEREDR